MPIRKVHIEVMLIVTPDLNACSKSDNILVQSNIMPCL